MLKIARALFVGATFLTAIASASWADDAKPSKKFIEPPLGLGADIPDDLLFGKQALTGGKPRSRVTVRSRSKLPPSPRPILKGWKVRKIQRGDDNGWQASEPIRPGCLDSHAILSSLSEAGWTKFQNYQVRRRSLAFDARRRDGRTKRVQVDRCTGEIIHVSASYVR